MCYTIFASKLHGIYNGLFSKSHVVSQFTLYISLIICTIFLSVDIDSRLSSLVWVAMFISLMLMVAFPRPSGARTFLFAIILRLFFSIGLEATLVLLGIVNVSFISATLPHVSLKNHQSKSCLEPFVKLLFISAYLITVSFKTHRISKDLA